MHIGLLFPSKTGQSSTTNTIQNLMTDELWRETLLFSFRGNWLDFQRSLWIITWLELGERSSAERQSNVVLNYEPCTEGTFWVSLCVTNSFTRSSGPLSLSYRQYTLLRWRWSLPHTVLSFQRTCQFLKFQILPFYLFKRSSVAGRQAVCGLLFDIWVTCAGGSN